MAKRRRSEDYYRELKKELNKYHKFSFPMPRKGVDLSRQQKAAITRQHKKLKDLIEPKSVFKDNTYIPYKEGKKYSGVEGIRTNKGLFISGSKDAVIKTDKKTRRQYLVVPIGEKTFSSHKFPRRLIMNPALIDDWVEELKARHAAKGYATDSVMWLRHGTINSSRYEKGLFALYKERAELARKEDGVHHNKENIGAITGVSIVVQKTKRVTI